MMKVLVDIPDDEGLQKMSTCEVQDLIKESLDFELYEEGEQTGGVQITILDPHDRDTDPEYVKFVKAGVYVINMASYMYDGCIGDITDCLEGMTKKDAKQHVKDLNEICEALEQVIRELQFERGLTYMIKHEW